MGQLHLPAADGAASGSLIKALAMQFSTGDLAVLQMAWLSACSVTEALAKQVFSDYRSSVKRGQPHPAAISEAASLS